MGVFSLHTAPVPYLRSPSAALIACLFRNVLRSFSLVCLDSRLSSSFLCLLTACKESHSRACVKLQNMQVTQTAYSSGSIGFSGRTRVCFFSSGASPSNTKTGLMWKKSSLQMRLKRVRRWAFWILLPSRSLTPFTAWFSQMLMSGGVWLRLMLTTQHSQLHQYIWQRDDGEVMGPNAQTMTDR